ncbi:putative uncharacterized protein [Parachlamydia acanthamoebae UV-7]|jgi:TolA-binding protein|uniref:Uncharacterized protein n=3 Tax=Parachlamydiaceae TaxID=92713 RepID=F8KWI3_PARAV|nr:hypothetical protein DB43_AS00290 [Parachlamydia acanthamoebae]CCB85381.1 putative uncharacterized protein [Parachlamydia acanthamoebae UV-7]
MKPIVSYLAIGFFYEVHFKEDQMTKKLSLLLVTLVALTQTLFADELRPITADTPRFNQSIESEANPLAQLDHVIKASEELSQQQKQLKELLTEYVRMQNEYIHNQQDREMLFRLVKVAYKAQTLIEETHLSHAFPPEFLKELSLFSQVGAKRGLPRPS